MRTRADISARGFWCRGQGAFFHVRIFDPNAQRHENKTLKRCYELNELGKKRNYNSRILNVEQGLFPSRFLNNRWYGKRMLVKQLCQMISLK